MSVSKTVLKSKDNNGNIVEVYPKTSSDIVEGLSAALAGKVSLSAVQTGVDYNDFNSTGYYEIIGTSENPVSNAPDNTGTGNFGLHVHARETTYFEQTAYSMRSDAKIYHRTCAGGTFTAWKRMANEDDIAAITALL